MPLFLVEPGVAVGDGIRHVVADRDRDIVVLLSVPKVNLNGDVLKPESPGLRVQRRVLIGPATARPERLLEGIDEHLLQLGLIQLGSRSNSGSTTAQAALIASSTSSPSMASILRVISFSGLDRMA
jgi:hypothetical protein